MALHLEWLTEFCQDGRGAWAALTNQYAGKDKWETEIKKQDDLLHTHIWKGQSTFPLEGFIGQHRNAFVSMQQCAEHVEYQLPNEHTRVGYLLEGIQCSDAGLQAAMASVRTDDGPMGMRNTFETAVVHLLPYDPVAKNRRNASKRDAGQISSVEVNTDDANISSTTGNKEKQSIGSTGVHLCYHTKDEYSALTKEQKQELCEWRMTNPNPKAGGGSEKKPSGSSTGQLKRPTKRQLSSAVAKELKKLEILRNRNQRRMKPLTYPVW